VKRILWVLVGGTTLDESIVDEKVGTFYLGENSYGVFG